MAVGLTAWLPEVTQNCAWRCLPSNGIFRHFLKIHDREFCSLDDALLCLEDIEVLIVLVRINLLGSCSVIYR